MQQDKQIRQSAFQGNSNHWMLMLLAISLCVGIPVLDTAIFSISLTDCLVLIFIPFILFRIWSSGFKASLTLPDFGLIIFVMALLISLFAPIKHGIFFSLLGLARPVLFYISVRILFTLLGTTALPTLNRAFSLSILLLMGSGLLGLLLTAFDISNPFVLIRDYYYGLIPVQLSGLDGHPNGAAQFLFISALMVFFTRPVEQKFSYIILLLAMVGLLLTQAKSNLLYLAVVILIYLKWTDYPKLKRRLGYIFSTSLICIYLLISHFFPVTHSVQQAHQDQIPAYFDTSQVMYKGEDFTIYPTHYTTNKIAAWTCFQSYPWTGIGPGNYIPFIDSLQKTGDYPITCRFKNPHSMYTGILAKFGLTGLLGLMALILMLTYYLDKLPGSDMRILFIGLFTVLFFDGFTADMEYSRVGWFMVAWLASFKSEWNTPPLLPQPPLPRDQKQ